MLERSIQERFVSYINAQNEIAQPQTNPLRIYKELVHYRFNEVIRNAMPIFCDVLSEERLNKLIFEFIRSKPKTPYVWQIPALFMHFLLEADHVSDIDYAADLMWFESVEIELLMGQYEKPDIQAFEWERKYKLSSSMRMKVLHYAVNQDEFKYVQEHPLILYYHFEEYGIFYKEITVFMYQFLSFLDDKSPKEALSLICEAYGVHEEDEVEALLQGALEEFVLLSIITPE